MDNQRNMILAIVLSAIVLFGWSALSDRFFPTANPPATKVVDGKSVPVPQPGIQPTATAPSAIRDRAAVHVTARACASTRRPCRGRSISAAHASTIWS